MKQVLIQQAEVLAESILLTPKCVNVDELMHKLSQHNSFDGMSFYVAVTLYRKGKISYYKNRGEVIKLYSFLLV